MICSITGHRPKSLDGSYNADTPLWHWIATQLQLAYTRFDVDKVITGMALGVDMLAAEVAQLMHIPFIAAVPHKGQEKSWQQEQKDRYEKLLVAAEEVVIVSEGGYQAWKMHKRNEWMVNNSDMQIAVWNGADHGGTYNAVRYAQRKRKPIWVIDPLRFRCYTL